MNNIAFIQGRLVNIVNDKIQAFPRDEWELELEIASASNLNFIELTVDLDRIWENPISSSLGVKHLKKMLSKFNMLPIACTADFIMQGPPWKENSESLIEITKKIIHGLGRIGCKYIVIPFVDDSKIIDKNVEDEAIKFLLSLKPFLVHSGVQVAIESDYEPQKLINFINRLPSDIYGINYDIGNSASLGYDVKEEFDMYFERIKHVHIKDRVLNGTTVPLGEGNADLGLCFELLRNFGYCGDFSMQTARDVSGKHLEVMLKYINTIIELLKNE